MRLKDGVNEDRMKIPSFHLEKVGGVLIFYCNYDLNLLELNNMPVFYIDVLENVGRNPGGTIKITRSILLRN